MKNQLISIIVPVYKVEEYLSSCIESILAQTYLDIEVILVDDGSPDKCGEICDEYARKDNRIKVIHQQNGGVVVARNAGVKKSIGKYLMFIDADDYISSDMCEELILSAETESSDIVWSDVIIENHKNIVYHKTNFDLDPTQMVHALLQNKVMGWLWNKLIRKSFYLDSHIITDPNCTIMEDKYILLQLLCNYPKMSYIPKGFYHYMLRETSAINSLTISPLIKGIPNVQHMYSLLQSKGLWKEYKVDFCRFAMTIKLLLLKDSTDKRAKELFSFAHKDISNYPLPLHIAIFYWIRFNTQYIGSFIFKILRK